MWCVRLQPGQLPAAAGGTCAAVFICSVSGPTGSSAEVLLICVKCHMMNQHGSFMSQKGGDTC